MGRWSGLQHSRKDPIFTPKCLGPQNQKDFELED